MNLCNDEYESLVTQLRNMLTYDQHNRKEKFDLLFKILNVFLDKLNFKEEKQFLIDSFIKRKFSNEKYFLKNLCNLLRNIDFKLVKYSMLFKINKEHSINQSCTFEIDHSSSKFNAASNSRIERDFKNKNDKLDFKCLNNKNNQIRNNLIIKPTRGIPLISNLESDEIFQNFYKFIMPTTPILNCSVYNYDLEKYNYKIQESKQSKIQSNLNKSEINYEYNLNKFTYNILYDWLSECYLLKQSDIPNTSIEDIISRCSNGVLLADLINVMEGKLNPIRGIDRTNTSFTKNKLNVVKILDFLRGKENINRSFLYDEDKIIQGDAPTIIGLLFDLYQFYNYKHLHVRNIKKSFVTKFSTSEALEYHRKIKVNKLPNKLQDDDMIPKLNSNKKIQEDFLILDSSENLEKFKNKIENTLSIKSTKNKKVNNRNYGNFSVEINPKSKQFLTRFQCEKLEESDFNISITSNNYINSDRDKQNIFNSQFSSNNKIKMTNTENFYSQQISSPRSKFHDDVDEIKNWLISLGIKFAKDIDFTKPQIQEFRDGLLILEIISILDTTNKIIYEVDNYPKSKAEAINNIKKALKILEHNKKGIPLQFLNCEEEIYNAESHFVLSFLKILKKSYHLETEFNETLIEKQIKNSVMFSPCISAYSNWKNLQIPRNKSTNTLRSCFNNPLSRNPIRLVKANKKDNSQRKFYSPNKLERNIIFTHPKYAWN